MSTTATTTVTCQAGVGWRTESVDGFPYQRVELCGQTVDLRLYSGADDRRHYHCWQPGHRQSVERRFPSAVSGSVAWNEFDD